ncbi:MAG: CAAX amino terminal protease self- immunity [Firmicutes bacterium ADurb.BinA052]|nr:MAG: CAAX amino terminal protease self- immunity [Firmicutes bacterium ADurb.BinA052]
MKRLFVSEKGRLRPGWRVVVVLIIYSVLRSMLLAALPRATEPSLEPNSLLQLAASLIPPTSLILATLLTLAFIDKKAVRDMGHKALRARRRHLIYGLALGAGSMSAVFAFLLALEAITLEQGLCHPQISCSLLSGLILHSFVGFSEELFCRGYIISALAETWNLRTSAVASSLLFSLLHVLNPNASLLGLVNTLLAGGLFAYMFVRSGNLWMPVGYHVAWNYFEGHVLGFPVSGTQVHGVYTVASSHNEFLAGGAYGPEGGFMVTLVLLAGFCLVWRSAGLCQVASRDPSAGNVNRM